MNTIVSSGKTSSNLIVSSGNTVTVNLGGTLYAAKIYSGGSGVIDGKATSTTILSNGKVTASENASLLSTTISSGGSLWASSGAAVSGTIMKAGAFVNGMYLSSNYSNTSRLVVSNVQVLDGSKGYVYASQSALKLNVRSSGTLYVSNGGYAST